MGGTRVSFLRSELCSVVCFAYIAMYHGAEWMVCLWCALNFVEVNLETLGSVLERTRFVQDNVVSVYCTKNALRGWHDHYNVEFCKYEK
jgi:hypothetical protein